jgi:hypothetical protein
MSKSREPKWKQAGLTPNQWLVVQQAEISRNMRTTKLEPEPPREMDDEEVAWAKKVAEAAREVKRVQIGGE